MKIEVPFLSKISRISVFLTFALTLLGLTSFFIMPREEDPRIKRRNAVTTIVLPGAEPAKIERMVTRPIEDELRKVEELKRVEVEIRLNVAVLKFELRDDVSDLSQAWREVEDAIDRARPKLPLEVGKPLLDFGVLDVEAVIVAVTGDDDRVVLIDSAKKLRDQLMKSQGVSEIKLFGAPEIELLVEVDSAKMQAHGVSVGQLIRGLQENNSAGPTGLIVDSNDRVLLNQDNDFKTVEEISRVKYETGRLNTVSLGTLAKITRTSAEPSSSLFRWRGQMSVGLGIVPKQGLNVQTFGENLKRDLEVAAASIAPLKVEMVAFQPERTKERIDDLMISLLAGMILIGIFLSLTVGGATALIVSVCVPIISLIGLFIYYLTGGVLHQISIAAFVISIGQFIDNIIVVIDSIQMKVRGGQTAEAAAAEASAELRSPMAFATATGICAFLPMLSAQGSPADFIFSLPLVAVITLITSYFVAIFFTPILAGALLRSPSVPLIQLPFGYLERGFSAIALGPFWRITVVIAVIAVASLVGFLNIEREFFPESDRNEFLFAIELNPSADSAATLRVLKKLEDRYAKDPRVRSLAAFAGGDIPRFYYNIPNPKAAPQAGQVLVTTNTRTDVASVGLEMETYFRDRYPDYGFTAQFLQQGPPINAKIEVNVFSENPKRRAVLTNEVVSILQGDSRTRSVRSDEFDGLRQLHVNANPEKLADIGISRNDLSQTLSFYSSGVAVSAFRFDREITSLRVRAADALYRKPESLKDVTILRGRDRDFKLSDLATFETESRPPVLRRENGETFSRVLSDLLPTFTFDRVMRNVKTKIDQIPLEVGETIRFGGDAKGAGDANDSILKVVPPAMILLIVFLLIEFRSIRKVMIAMLALPVTLMGVFPGLWVGQAPFGFMSLLGILALVGISINNIILLLEAMDSGASLKGAIAIRLRAIVLTTVLTVLGLIPLAFSSSSLWPPLAWTMISGLLTGTVATLIFVPALYRLFFRKAVVGVCGVVMMFAATSPEFAAAQSTGPLPFRGQIELTVDEILEKIYLSEDSKLNDVDRTEAESADKTTWRQAFAPRISIGGNLFRRDRELQISSPFGDLAQERRFRADAQLEVRQSLFDLGKMSAARTAAEQSLAATTALRDYNRQALRLKFGSQTLGILMKQRELRFLDDSIANLRARQKDVKRLIEKGRQSRSDSLKLEIAIDRTGHLQEALRVEIASTKADLQAALKIDGELMILQPEAPRDVSKLKFDSATGDFLNLKFQTEVLNARQKEVRAIGLPSVDGYARVVATEGRTLTDRQWGEVGIELKWELWGGGVRSSQTEQIEARKLALSIQDSALRRTKSAAFRETQQQAIERLRWTSKMVNLETKAAANRKEEETRYFEGRGSLNDLIEADSLALEISRERDVTALQLLIDCMQLQLWAGDDVSSKDACKKTD